MPARRRVLGLGIALAEVRTMLSGLLLAAGLSGCGSGLFGGASDESFRLGSISGSRLPAVFFLRRNDDGTTRSLVATGGRLTLLGNGRVIGETDVQRFTDSTLTGTEVGRYEGTYTHNSSTLVIRFRPGDAYEATVEYELLDNGRVLGGIDITGSYWVYRRVDGGDE